MDASDDDEFDDFADFDAFGELDEIGDNSIPSKIVADPLDAIAQQDNKNNKNNNDSKEKQQQYTKRKKIPIDLSPITEEFPDIETLLLPPKSINMSNDQMMNFLTTKSKIKLEKTQFVRVNIFNNIVIIGNFQWAIGHYVAGLILNNNILIGSHNMYKITQYILPYCGLWQTDKEKVCLLWVREVCLAFRMVVDESVAEMRRSMPTFLDYDYHRPTSLLNEITGDISVTLWVKSQEQDEEVDDDIYEQLLYVFKQDGSSNIVQLIRTAVIHLKHKDLVH